MSVTMPWTASDDTPVNGVANKIDEVRHALSKEAEHLTEMAARYSRDAGAHASDIADDAAKQASKIAADAGKQANKLAKDTSKIAKDTTAKAQDLAADPAKQAGGWIDQLLKAIAALGTAFALSGKKTADDLNANAKSVADDLGKLRLTTEPKKTGPDFTPGITLLAGFGAGIALMYFLDPEKGLERRNMVRDRLMSLTKPKAANNDWASEETQAWQPDSYGTSDNALESSEFSSPTGFGSTDSSTTDAWGTQPQTTGSTEIDIR